MNRGPSRPASRDAVARRYPRVVAHLICASLGYATPTTAAAIAFDAIRRQPNWCEWVYSCFGANPVSAVQSAIRGRHGHRGYMAHYPAARALVDCYNETSEEPVFASWF